LREKNYNPEMEFSKGTSNPNEATRYMCNIITYDEKAPILPVSKKEKIAFHQDVNELIPFSPPSELQEYSCFLILPST
jgi:hypothetical protein